MTLQKNNDDKHRVEEIVNTYFDALHHADVDRLQTIFHPDAWLKTPNSRRSLDRWLTDVATRPIPAELGHARKYQILSLDLVRDQAMVKVNCPLFEHNYVDFLGLLKEQGEWRIVNKMYTDLA